LWCAVGLAAILCVGITAASAGAQPRPPWWDRAWPYRKIITIPKDKQPSPDSTAAAVWLHIGGRGLPDGADIRIISPEGRPLPFGILHSTDDGRHLVVFRAPQKEGAYAAYFGNRKATNPQQVFPKLGLTLKTIPLPKGINANKWESVKKALDECTDMYGIDYWPRVFDGYNPFGPQKDYISVYDGYIHCPTAGVYKFATLSDQSSFLLVDGHPVAVWTGSHNIYQGRKGEHGGEVTLKSGTHRFTYVNFAIGRATRAAAAWIPPGAKWWEIIPESAFQGPLHAEVVQCEKVDSPVCADFRIEPLNYLEVGTAQMVAVRFHTRSSAAKGLVQALLWQFGDGQSATSSNPIHVYFAPGPYEVRLSVRATGGATDTVVRRVKVDPVWHDLDFRKWKMDRFANWAKGCKIEKLPTESLLAARQLYMAVKQEQNAFLAAAELDRRRSELKPSDLYEVAMHLGLYHQKKPSSADIAEKYFNLALQNAGNDVNKQFNARFHLAGHYAFHMNRPEEGLRAYESLRTDFPQTDPARRRMALILMGDIYRNQGKLEKALELYGQAEKDPAYILKEPEPIVSGRFAHDAEAYLRQGKGQDALDSIEKWLWHYPTKRIEGYPMLLRVKAHLLMGDYQEAKKQAELFIGFSTDPDYVPQLHVQAGDACIEMGLLDEAREHFRVVMEDFPESPAAQDAQNEMARLKE